MTSLVKRCPLTSYFILAFGVAWAGIFLVVGPGGFPGKEVQFPRLLPWVFLAMLTGPSLAGILMTGLVDGREGLRGYFSRLGRWRVGLRWYGPLLITPLLILAILAVLSRFSPAFVPGILAAKGKAGVIGFALVVGLGAGFFEELGWTGFATPKLLARHSVLAAGLLLGVLHSLWHFLPDFWGAVTAFGALYPIHFLLWLVALTAFRVLMTWVYSHTGSLLLGQLMHASFAGGQALIEPKGVSAPENVFWYGCFAAGLWLVVAVVASAGGFRRSKSGGRSGGRG